MSLVIAIKDGDRFVIGADKQGTLGGNRTHTSTKVWPVKGYSNCIMGGVGLCRANQVLQYCSGLINKNDFDDEMNIDEEYVAMILAPTIYEVLKTYGIVTKIGDEDADGNSMAAISNSYVFAYKDKAWMIGQDLCVEEIDDYIAIGSGSDIARGVLYATKDKNPFERIAMAIDAAASYSTTVDDYIDVEVTVEKESDEEDFNNAMFSNQGMVDLEDVNLEELSNLLNNLTSTAIEDKNGGDGEDDKADKDNKDK